MPFPTMACFWFPSKVSQSLDAVMAHPQLSVVWSIPPIVFGMRLLTLSLPQDPQLWHAIRRFPNPSKANQRWLSLVSPRERKSTSTLLSRRVRVLLYVLAYGQDIVLGLRPSTVSLGYSSEYPRDTRKSYSVTLTRVALKGYECSAFFESLTYLVSLAFGQRYYS